jgi:hypothetical protein
VQQLTKPQVAKSMMARAIRGGVKVDFLLVDFLLADAWFGTKAMLRNAGSSVIFVAVFT